MNDNHIVSSLSSFPDKMDERQSYDYIKSSLSSFPAKQKSMDSDLL
jgi:hypothetical protein